MKIHSHCLCTIAALAVGLFATTTASAQVVYQYSADAASRHPTDQGWTYSGTVTDFTSPHWTIYQNENAYRIEDADESNPGYQYTIALSNDEITTLQSRGYRVHARVAFLDTSYNDSQSCNFYIADGTRRFLVGIDESGSGDLVINLAIDGGSIALNLGNADVNGFYNIAIDVAPGGTTASVLINGEERATDWTGQTSSSQFIRFGNGSSSGRGAAAWNRVQIASRVPESNMTFLYDTNTDSFELHAVSTTASGHLHVPNTHNGKAVTIIGDKACSPSFNGISGLTSLRLPASLTTIDDYAFNDCSGLAGTLTIPDGVTSIGRDAFYDCGFTGSLTIPDGVTSIERDTFYGCSRFTGSLTIPDGVTSIGESAFYECSGFDGTLTIPDSVTSIGISAFRNCSRFTGSLTIPNGVTSIGNNVFQNCSGFDGTLSLPANLQTIGSEAFRDCRGLTGSLTIPDGVTSIGSYAFQNCNDFDGTLTLPTNLKTISNKAFNSCSSLTGSLIIPDSVTSIGNSAFANCGDLTSLTLPANLQTIGIYAFVSCDALRGTLTIPASVTSIGDFAFNYCDGLEEVCWLGAPPTTYGDSPFFGTPATYYVPAPHLTAYQALEGLSGAQVKPGTEVVTLSTSLSGTTLTVTYLSVNGVTHTPQFSTDLQSWSNHGSAQTGNGSEQSFTAPASGTHGYLRILSQ